MKRLHAVLAVAALAVATAACGGGGENETDTGKGGSGGVAIAVKTFQFKPNPAQVKSGQKVTWTNSDDTTHTATAGTPDSKTGVFDGKLEGPGSTFSFTFDKAGTYPYFCAIHTSMTGQITVT